MTKVEELREILLSHLGAEGRNERWCVEEADALIAAVREEQKTFDEADVSDHLESLDIAHAEGVAGERERILRASRPLNRVYELAGPCVLVQTSVLAPTKEGEQDNTTEEEYEDMRRNGGPEVKP